MLYRTMPKNGDTLSALGFGCMRLPMRDGKVDETRAIAQIRSAIDGGVNYVDTAWPYHNGESEIVLGKALRDGYREKVRVATKLPSWLVKDRADMDRYLDAQLERLGVSCIDYYLVHALDGPLWDTVHGLGVLEFLEAAKTDGRIANAGFSFHGLAEDFKRIIDAYPWVFCQIQYNYLDETYQAGTEGLRYAAGKGIGVIIMEPLRGGNLGLITAPPAVQAIWDESPVRRTPVEWALRWIWNHPEVTVVLSGMNEEAHIAENLAIAGSAEAGSMGPRDLELVARASARYRELMKVRCTGCGYCMPCPMGVAIPMCFETYNKMHMFGNIEEGKFLYAMRMSGEIGGEGPGYASQCVACGQCVENCPQHIAIPDVLAELAAELEGPDFAQLQEAGRQMIRRTL
ncbi:aldo/keto reductase [Nitratidesulfovibrio sp. 1201_IL3209]|uniref:aldo/keto reductase n=1 Tax=Nitratidesulfovibrio sp. 1201_IL3209 TaxID=3084053 RepID=UPI002FDA9A88